MNKSLFYSLWFWLGVAIVARFYTSYFAYGPQSLDEYRHGFMPALEWSLGKPMTLPDFRSPLIAWLISLFYSFGQFIGATSLLSLTRIAMGCLGLVSLLVPYAFHLWAKKNLQNKKQYPVFMFFSCLHFLLPFVSTRGFGEAVAMSFLTLGIVLVALSLDKLQSNKNVRQIFFGFILIGLATLFRFHVGLIFVGLGLALLIKHKAHFKSLFFTIGFAGLLTLSAQLGIDYLFNREFLETLRAYLSVNSSGAVEYGVSPWYGYLPVLLFAGLFPFSIAAMKEGFKKENLIKHWVLVFPFVLFVVVHSLVPHKEERFLYPIVALWILFLLTLWAVTAKNNSKVLNWSAMGALAMNAIALVVMSSMTSLKGEIEPGMSLSSLDSKQFYFGSDSLFEQSRMKRFITINGSAVNAESDFNKISIVEVDDSFTEVVLVTSSSEVLPALRQHQNKVYGKFNCGEAKIHTNWTDQMIYKMNPNGNKRRRPSWSITCDRT